MNRESQTRDWRYDELAYVRREAQTEAELAYGAWCRLPDTDGYTVYRAAQDRADAAQDELAAWARRTPTRPAFWRPCTELR